MNPQNENCSSASAPMEIQSSSEDYRSPISTDKELFLGSLIPKLLTNPSMSITLELQQWIARGNSFEISDLHPLFCDLIIGEHRSQQEELGKIISTMISKQSNPDSRSCNHHSKNVAAEEEGTSKTVSFSGKQNRPVKVFNGASSSSKAIDSRSCNDHSKVAANISGLTIALGDLRSCDDDSKAVAKGSSRAQNRAIDSKATALGDYRKSVTIPGEANPHSRFTCEICFDLKPYSARFHISGCNHPYCSECICNYIASKLPNNISTIKCPYRCEGYLDFHQCSSILPKDVIKRWGDALCEAVILGSEKFYCPFKDCSALLVHDNGNDGTITESECPYCHRLFCAHCKVGWHSGLSCNEFQQSNKLEGNDDDLKLKNLAEEKNWMRCSNCNAYVEKSSGCNYMICRCGHGFCYMCGTQMGNDHYCRRCKR